MDRDQITFETMGDKVICTREIIGKSSKGIRQGHRDRTRETI